MAEKPQTRVVYVGVTIPDIGGIVLKCLTCSDKPLITNRTLHEEHSHPRAKK